mgnify:CR=1 FL=1
MNPMDLFNQVKEMIEKKPDQKPKNAFYERLDRARTNEKISTNSFFDQHKREKNTKKELRTMWCPNQVQKKLKG